MASRARLGKFVPAILVVAAVFLAVPETASAQFGFGGGFGGFGYGGFGFRPVPTPESYLYSKSLVDASRPVNWPSRDVNANNPNSFINHLRDPGFVDRYSVDRREIPDYRYGPRPRRVGGASTTPTAASANQGRILPLFSFYNAAGKLEWPADAPVEGDLKAKRDQVG